MWLGGDARTRAMLLLFAHLLTAHYRWRSMEITVFDHADSDAEKAETKARLQALLDEARIEARARVVLRQGRTLRDLMHVESDDADFALVGISLPGEGQSATAFSADVAGMLEELPTTILVHSAQSFEHEQVLLDRE